MGVYGANRAFPEADYLSDEIYRYDRDTHRLSVIPASVQEEQAGMCFLKGVFSETFQLGVYGKEEL